MSVSSFTVAAGSWHRRLREMALGWGFVGLVYSVTGAGQVRPVTVLAETALDRAIPFDPAGIWAYLSFFALIPCAYLLCEAGRLRWLRLAMQMCACVCGAVYVGWPTTLVYPSIEGTSASAELLRQLARSDAATNCLPSLHGALSLLAIWALMPPRGRPVWRVAGLCLWGLVIAYSVVQTRRHLALDLGAGVALGALCGAALGAVLGRGRGRGCGKQAATGAPLTER